jgi:hypothetical protein
VSTPLDQAARQTLPADKRLRQSYIWSRETSDHYVEPTWVSIRLFEVEDFDRSQVLLDPCTGFGRIAEAAKAAGYTVVAADIVDRGYPGCVCQSAFKFDPSSASNFDPFARRALLVALVSSELAGIAEARRARVA